MFIFPYIGIIMGASLIYGAARESMKPASQYKAAYAPIGTRSEPQALVWFVAGIAFIAVSLDYIVTGGATVQEVLGHTR